MNLTITEIAVEKLKALNTHNQNYLVLLYDNDGCDCSVSGIPTIRFSNNRKEKDNDVTCTEFDVIVDSFHEMFFESEVKLDFIGNVFRLSSPAGMLNPVISRKTVIKEVLA
ncbi:MULTISPECIES: iron-sulfur cluster biosynthesis family protein [Paraliobacillus]|uniref:iron-sulfur cluster biosynthesis family protein n=1 Tax=Paraliobacillus TaxID=200903 RepID=UPI001300401E|nr:MULTISPECIES: iron-sulfur cluster biosynthesis family protein [Paraliobacillus]